MALPNDSGRPKGRSGQILPKAESNPGVRDNANSESGSTVGAVISGGRGAQSEMGERGGFKKNEVSKGPKPQ